MQVVVHIGGRTLANVNWNIDLGCMFFLILQVGDTGDELVHALPKCIILLTDQIGHCAQI